MHWKSKSWILIGILLAAFTAAHAQIVTTQVADTIYHADGTPATGTALISWPAFTSSNGDAIPAGSTSAVIAAGGALSVQLIPNAGATPIGSYYTVVYHLDDGSVSRQYWVVPASSSPVKVSAIESTVLPTSVAMQTVSKSYVDTAIAVAVAGHPLDSSAFILKAGDTMTGPLVLPADPVSAMQAADKNYIDESVAAVAGGLGQKLSLGGDVGGTASAPVVTGIQGNPVSATAPAIGQALTWNGSAYVPATSSSGDFASPPAIGNVTGIPQMVGVATNYPAIPVFGGNYTYASYGQSCSENTLPNDPGDYVSSQCEYIAYDNDNSPGWNYGNATAPLADGWFTHGTFSAPNIQSYSVGIHSSVGMYSGAWYSSGDFDGRRSYEIFKPAAIAPSDEGIVLDGDSPQEAGEGTYTVNSTAANGTAFALTCTSNCPSMGINHPFIDVTKVATNTITAWANTGMWNNVNSATVSTAVPVSVSGTLAANVLVPRITFFAASTPLLPGDIVYDGLNQQVVTTAGTTGSSAPAWNTTVGGTTASGSVTFTNKGLQTTLPSQVLTATFNTATDLSTLPAPLLCEVMQPTSGGNDGGYQEMIGPDATGPIIFGTYNSGAHTQTVTANWHYGHLSGSQFYCGGPVGEYVEFPQYTIGGNRYVQQIFGSTDAHTILFGFQNPGGFRSDPPPLSWLPEAVNIYPGAEIYGIGSSIAGSEVYGVTTGANPDTWANGDSVEAVNHISAGSIGNAYYPTFNNPFALRMHFNVLWQGYGGGANVQDGEYFWDNPNPYTGYLGEYASGTSGPQGIYSAPSFIDINGPVANGIAFDQPPVASGISPAYHAQCAGWAVCFANAPDSGRVSQIGGFLYAYAQGQLDVNYATNGWELSTGAGGLKLNGSAVCTLASGCGGGGSALISDNGSDTVYISPTTGGGSGNQFAIQQQSGGDTYIQNQHSGGQLVFGTLGHATDLFFDAYGGTNIGNAGGSAAKFDIYGDMDLTNTPNPTAVKNLTVTGQYVGPATAPTGGCSTNGAWVFSQDGHATFCAAGTWTTKI